MDMTLRGLDEDIYRQAKSRAALMGITIGRAVNLALERWLEEKDGGKPEKALAELLRPIRFGSGTERSSALVDETVYGGRP